MNKFFQWIIGISIILLVGTFVLSALVPLFVLELRQRQRAIVGRDHTVSGLLQVST